MAVTTAPVPKRKKRATQASREARLFYLCVAPWVIGFILLTLGPMLISLYLSFTRWDVLTAPEFISTRNFEFIFTRDVDFGQSLKVTTTYAIFSIPLQLLVALGLAILLNEATAGVGFFRTVFYLPAVVASVAAAVLWAWIFNSEVGPVNGFLGLFGIKGPAWFADPNYALSALVIMSVWGVGGQMLIFLAGLKGIPKPLYEASEIDGAGRVARFFSITLPMLSSTIFFNVVMAIIGAFQTFDAAYVISTQRAGTLGGPLKSTLFYMLYTYSQAFGSATRMGYAAALSWILFFVILILTLITIRSSTLWVYYESERKG
ncbi:MAG: sugar ABC transporter permease [Chloroflexi bacterium]|nr:sugar ABC transporter permease [Chloroflexota bacterium]